MSSERGEPVCWQCGDYVDRHLYLCGRHTMTWKNSWGEPWTEAENEMVTTRRLREETEAIESIREAIRGRT